VKEPSQSGMWVGGRFRALKVEGSGGMMILWVRVVALTGVLVAALESVRWALR